MIRSNNRIFGPLRTVAIVAFVIWHLFFLFITNASIESDWLDVTVWRFESYTGLDQRWGMFSSPLWRSIPFPAVRLEFSDATSELVRSTNEPDDFTRFARFRAWRLRKLEHYLVTHDLVGTYHEPMQRRLVEMYAKRWRDENPSDPRHVVRGLFIRRDFKIPLPGERWQPRPTPSESVVATFDLRDD